MAKNYMLDKYKHSSANPNPIPIGAPIKPLPSIWPDPIHSKFLELRRQSNYPHSKNHFRNKARLMILLERQRG